MGELSQVTGGCQDGCPELAALLQIIQEQLEPALAPTGLFEREDKEKEKRKNKKHSSMSNDHDNTCLLRTVHTEGGQTEVKSSPVHGLGLSD